MKKNYLIQKILNKLLDLKGKSCRQKETTLSIDGKNASSKYYETHQYAKSISPPRLPASSEKEAYLKYQREIKAGQHVDVDYTPEKPGTIPKLPKPKRII